MRGRWGRGEGVGGEKGREAVVRYKIHKFLKKENEKWKPSIID